MTHITTDTNLFEARSLGKSLGSILSNDMSNIIQARRSSHQFVSDYRRDLNAICDLNPGVLVQHVGLPDPVSYQSEVATNYSKYIVEVNGLTDDPPIDVGMAANNARRIRELLDAGTDPLQLAIDVCRERDILIVASYRMNDAHWGDKTYLLSDFGREHPEWRIPSSEFDRSEQARHDLVVSNYTGVMDPAIPQVLEHRMKILAEVAQKYDIDGIELDFRRWIHMVSDPLKNHAVLTQMVRRTRKMLDDVAKGKSRPAMMLGVRVAPSLDTEPNEFVYPGSATPGSPYLFNASCRSLGLDVEAWVKEQFIDYVCPSLFIANLPGLPKTREFADLTAGTGIGVYPTVWSISAWQGHSGGKAIGLDDHNSDRRAQSLFKHELCAAVLKAYEDGADGINSFNWVCHLRDADHPNKWKTGGKPGPGGDAIMRYIYPLLSSPEAVRKYRDEPWALPPGHPA